jgi:SAM-dependent methyltransferase
MSDSRTPDTKIYDQDYFERWYRDPRYAVIHHEVLARRVQLAVSAAEFVLERRIRRVLDVGCGEGPWRELLKIARPNASYLGVDSSEYAIKRYGKSRNLKLGRFGDVGRMGIKGPFDLIVCSDVLHYVETEEARRGLKAIGRLLEGLAFIEVFTSKDDTIGDDDEYKKRSPSRYREMFREAGLVHAGLHCFVDRALSDDLTSFEKGQK